MLSFIFFVLFLLSYFINIINAGCLNTQKVSECQDEIFIEKLMSRFFQNSLTQKLSIQNAIEMPITFPSGSFGLDIWFKITS
jgi:hypothetical protein